MILQEKENELNPGQDAAPEQGQREPMATTADTGDKDLTGESGEEEEDIPVKRNFVQFTAKASGKKKPFGDYIERVIEARIAQGLSNDRQHAIFQMMNFACNHCKDWSFGNPIPPPERVYLQQ